MGELTGDCKEGKITGCAVFLRREKVGGFILSLLCFSRFMAAFLAISAFLSASVRTTLVLVFFTDNLA